MLGPKNRWAMPLACASCPFGLAAVAEIQEARGQHTKAEQTRLRIYTEHPTAGEDITPCRWILTNDAAKRAQVLVACHAAYTPSLAAGRHQIVDEEPEIVRWLPVNPDAIHEWIDGLPTIEAGLRSDAKKLERKISYAEGQRAWEDGLSDFEMEELRNDLATLINQADRIFEDVDSWLIDFRAQTLDAMKDTTRRKLPADLAELILKLARWAKPIQDNASPIERGTMTWGAEPVVPLRAIMDLARAVKMDAIWIDGHGIHAAVPTAIGAEILDPSEDMTILSATPTMMLRDIADNVVEIPIDQGVALTMFPRHPWGKAGLRTDPKTLAATRTATKRFLAAMAHELDANPWGASHAALETGQDDDPVSIHYGNHRGTNNYAGKPGIIWGAHRLAPMVEAQRWDAHRAFAIHGGADPEKWPEVWTGERGEPGELVEMAPELHVASPMRHPLDPRQRAWLLDDLAIHLVQLNGRCRGAQHVADGGDPINMWYAGPPLPLGRYGIRVVAVRDDPPGVRRSGPDYRRSEMSDSDHRALLGVAAVRRENGNPVREAVNAWLRAHGRKGIGEHTWPKLVAAGLLDTVTPPEILADLDEILALRDGNLEAAGEEAAFIIKFHNEVSPVHPRTLAAAMVLALVTGTWSPPEPAWVARIDPPNTG